MVSRQGIAVDPIKRARLMRSLSFRAGPMDSMRGVVRKATRASLLRLKLLELGDCFCEARDCTCTVGAFKAHDIAGICACWSATGPSLSCCAARSERHPSQGCSVLGGYTVDHRCRSASEEQPNAHSAGSRSDPGSGSGSESGARPESGSEPGASSIPSARSDSAGARSGRAFAPLRSGQPGGNRSALVRRDGGAGNGRRAAS